MLCPGAARTKAPRRPLSTAGSDASRSGGRTSKVAVRGGWVPGLAPVSRGCSSLVGSRANASRPSMAASRGPISFPGHLFVRSLIVVEGARPAPARPISSRYICKDLIFQTGSHSEGRGGGGGVRASAYEFRGAVQPPTCAQTTPRERVGVRCCVWVRLCTPLCPHTHSADAWDPRLRAWSPSYTGGQHGAGSLSTHLLLTDLHVQVSAFRSHKSCWITLASPCPRSPCRAWGRWCDPVCKGPGRACCGRGCKGACRSQAATSEVGRGEAGPSRAHSPQKCKGQRASSHAFCSAATKHSCRLGEG